MGGVFIHVGVDVYRKVPFAIHADGRFLSLDETRVGLLDGLRFRGSASSATRVAATRPPAGAFAAIADLNECFIPELISQVHQSGANRGEKDAKETPE